MAKRLWQLGANDEVTIPADLSDIEDALAAINGGDYGPDFAKLAEWNTIKFSSPTVTNNSFALSQDIGIYRVSASVSSGVATIPTPSATAIDNSNSYFCFEMEVSVGSTATSLVGPTGWTWVADGELPTSDFANKTLYIAVRLDCAQGVRTFLANVWQVI